MQVVDKYGNTFGQGHLVITTKSGKSKLPVVTVAWGNITGVLANQTDLQDALNLKVPTSRTLTINGVTQDLSADRSWTISTGITVNTTPITGGTSGRLLFDDAGVVGETANISWEKTTNILTLNGDISYTTYNRTIASSSYPLGTLFTGTIRSISQINHSGGTNGLTIGGGGGSPLFRIYDTGNVVIQTGGTYTDAGFKLDVNGSVTFRGELRLNANIATGGNRNYLLGNSGDFEVTTNTTIKFRNFYNASDVYFSMNYGTGGRALFSGLTSATGYRLGTSGNVVPETAVARGVYFNNTLTASANNDVLVGLDISPTYTLGAFTGVYGVDLRTKNAGVVIGSGYGYGALYGYANDGIVQVVDGGTSSLSGGGYASQIWLRPAGNSAGLNSNYWATLEQSTGGLFIQSGRYNSNIVIKTGRAGTSGNIYFNNAGGTMAMFFGATANLGIATTTDAGYKLDIQGVARVYSTNTDAQIILTPSNGTSNILLKSQGSSLTVSTTANSFADVRANYSVQHLRIGAAAGNYGGNLYSYVGDSSSGFYWRTINSSSVEVDKMLLTAGGNLLIGTTTNAGYKLDVNGTTKVNEIVVDNGVTNTRARLTDSALQFTRLSDGGYTPSISRLQSAGGLLFEGYDGGHKFVRGATVLAYINVNNPGYSGSGYLGVTNIATTSISTGGNDSLFLFSDAASGSNDGIVFDRGTRSVTAVHSITTWKAAGVEKGRFTQGGSLLINTTTDGGYKLDVNGTTRVSSYLTIDGNNGTGGGQLFLKNGANDYSTQIGTSAYNLFLQTRGVSNAFNFWFGSSARHLSFNGGGTGDIEITSSVSYVANGLRNIYHGSSAITIQSDNYNNGNGVVINRGRSTVSTDPIISFQDFGTEKARINRAGNMLIGTTTDIPSAIINVNSTTQGFLPPRMTNAEMLAIGTPAEGLMVYDTTNRKLCCYDGATWQPLF